MRVKRIVTLAVVCLLLITLAHSRTMAVGNGTGISVTNALKHVDIAQIGEPYQGTIVVENQTDTLQQLTLYETDYLYHYDTNGVCRVDYGEPGQDPRSNADWISFDAHQSPLAPHEKRVIIYTVSVPSDETLVGSYWSMIMVEGSSESSPATSMGNENQPGASIISKVRYAVRIETNIGDTGVRDIAIIGSQMRKTDDGLSFQVGIENTGERALGPVVSLEVYDEQGDFIGRFASETGETSLHPGCSVLYQVPLPILGSGNYPAMLYVDNLDQYIWSAQVNMNVP